MVPLTDVLSSAMLLSIRAGALLMALRRSLAGSNELVAVRVGRRDSFAVAWRYCRRSGDESLSCLVEVVCCR